LFLAALLYISIAGQTYILKKKENKQQAG
jgi:hypothetical protein